MQRVFVQNAAVRSCCGRLVSECTCNGAAPVANAASGYDFSRPGSAAAQVGAPVLNVVPRDDSANLLPAATVNWSALASPRLTGQDPAPPATFEGVPLVANAAPGDGLMPGLLLDWDRFYRERAGRTR